MPSRPLLTLVTRTETCAGALSFTVLLEMIGR